MTKIKTTIETFIDDISKFYDAKSWHFITLNGIEIDENEIELQWIFSKYGVKDEIAAFYAIANFNQKIPSITHLIPSAIMSEREAVDMFGIDIEGAQKGLFLDNDSLKTPLRGIK